MSKANKRELARLFGKSAQTISDWMAEGCPVELRAQGSKGNVYDTVAVIEWHAARAVQQATGDAPSDYNAERTRLAKAQADKVELEIAELRGELIRVEHATEFMGQLVAATRAKFLAIPAKAAPMIAAPGRVVEAQEFMRGLIDEALNELAGDGIPPSARKARAGPKHLSRSAAVDSERVGGSGAKAKSRVKRRARKVDDSAG